MTILMADTTGLLDGVVITEVRLGALSAWQISRGAMWHIYDDNAREHEKPVRRYPDAPGMNALVALRRYLVERENDRIGRCDWCNEFIYRSDNDLVEQSVPIAFEGDAATWQAHRRCAEGED